MTRPAAVGEALLENALRRAFQLGQTYYQQADSDSFAEQRRSDETMERFRAHLRDTLAALAAPSPPEGVDGRRPNPNVDVIHAAMDALGRDHALYGQLDHAAAELAVLWARHERAALAAKPEADAAHGGRDDG